MIGNNHNLENGIQQHDLLFQQQQQQQQRLQMQHDSNNPAATAAIVTPIGMIGSTNNAKLSIPSHFLNLQQEHDHDQQQKQKQHQQQEQDDDMYDDTEQHIAERLAAAALDDDDDVVDDTILNDNIHETNVDQNVNNNGINGINDVLEEK